MFILSPSTKRSESFVISSAKHPFLDHLGLPKFKNNRITIWYTYLGRIRIHFSLKAVKSVLDYFEGFNVLDCGWVQRGQEPLLLVDPSLHIIRVRLQAQKAQLLMQLLLAQLKHVVQLRVASFQWLQPLLYLLHNWKDHYCLTNHYFRLFDW